MRSGVLAELSVVFACTSLLAVLHLTVAGWVPSGGDGGNWLAMAHQRLGAEVLTSGVTYPPLFPSILAVLLLIADPVPALVVAALFARVTAVLSVYLAMRGSGRVAALVAALLAGVAAFQLEAFAWGAYPQILASGLGVVATYCTVRFATHGRRRDAILAVFAALGVFVTHSLIAGLLLVALPLSIAHALWVSPEIRRRWRSTVGVVLAILVFGAAYLVGEVIAGEGRAVLNPTGQDLFESLSLAAGESIVPWVIVIAVAGFGLSHRQWTGDRSFSVSVGVSWLLASSAVFFVTGERRCLLAAQIGLIMLAVTEIERWWRSGRNLRRVPAPLFVFSAAMIGSILVPGLVQYRAATEFYRIVDEQEIQALRSLAGASQPGDTVVASRGRNIIPIGWWVEGVARLPTFTGHDIRFLTFPAEVAEAEAANSFYGGEMSPDEAVEFLIELDAQFLVVDRRGPDAQWLQRASALPVSIIDDSSSLVIFRVGPPSHADG